jgi:NADH dehydrogenase (ubiquinone) 1 alpha subcomplex subunit 12
VKFKTENWTTMSLFSSISLQGRRASSTLTKYVSQALGPSGSATKEQSLLESFKNSGGWKTIIDGNLAETVLAHGPGGELVGTDAHGNKYFEKVDAQSNRSRWVVFAGSTHYTMQNPTVVPPEWHGWLHYIVDENPSNASGDDLKAPQYQIEAKAHPSFTGPKYQPKGAWGTEGQRDWRKYQAWQPSR